MKKSLKITIIVFGILFFFILLISLLISPIAKRYIEKNSQELVGRVVTMEKFRFNMFTGSLRIVGFDMKEQNEQESFVKFDTLAVKVKLFDFLRHKVTVRKIHLSNLNLHVWQKGADFNFSDIIRKFSSTDTLLKDTLQAAPAEHSKPWEIGLYDIQFRGGNLLYNDLLVGSKWSVEDLNLKIPGVYFSEKETDIGFNLLFSDGGALGAKLLYDIEKSAYRVSLDLEHFSIAGLLPYLQQSMRIGTLTGLLDAHIYIDGEMEHVMNSVIQGTVALRLFDMRDDREELILAVDSLLVDMKEISLSESKYVLNEFSLRGLATRYVMEKDSSTNFSYLMKERTLVDTTQHNSPDTLSKEQQQAPAFHLSIGKIDLKGISVGFKDNTLQIPFIYELKDIAIAANDFDPGKNNKIDMKGKLGATGFFDIRWNGNFNDLSNLNLKAELKSVALKEFTPYALEYFAYPVSNGVMTFTSQNMIKSNMLKGTNGLDIFKCTVDKKRTDVKPEMKVPLRLAVYVLKDRNDKINLNLPVEGDITSPKFSYKKIIIKTLMNVLVKVSMAPLDFLASSMGFNADQLDEIEFSNMQDEYTSAQYDHFNQLAAIIQSKPDLVLGIRQDINYTQAVKEQSLFNLKCDYYLARNKRPLSDTLDMLDKAAITQVEDTDKDLMQYVNSLLMQPSEDDIYTKAVALYKDRVAGQIIKLAEQRSLLLKEYLTGSGKVPADNLNIEIVPWEQGKVYAGKSVFHMSLALPGEEPMMAAPEIIAAADSTGK